MMTNLALGQALHTFPRSSQLRMDDLGPRLLLRVRAVEEPIHVDRLPELHIRLGLVRLLCLPVELYALSEIY